MRHRSTSIGLGVLLAAGVATPVQAAGPTATVSALGREMRFAGSSSSALVVDVNTGETIYARRARAYRVPASVNKLHTTAAALVRLGPDASLGTDLLVAAPSVDGTVPGDVYLRGGGDFTFGARQANQLARALADAGVGTVRGRVIGDESYFDVRRGPPSTNYQTSSWVGPLSALSYDRGMSGRSWPRFQSRPALFAAQRFERALRRAGVSVRRDARTGTAPASARIVLRAPSLPLTALLARINQPSDNFGAEMLLKQLGARFAGDGSTARGARVVDEVMDELGVSARVVDGSGLSRSNRTTAVDVVTLLSAMDAGADGPAFEESLPVAGRSGTLRRRMRGTTAEGRCRAKTGTLTGVSALAGYCDAPSGRLAFAFLMNDVDVAAARNRQDRMTATLAAYESAPPVAARR
ncbi:MAG: D-alanyl-D-alanine carboxypeptidase [uncultured Solirubrobacteraceae bacterium]|uniref:D-alanyl-D-alanine carboxypeptidase n=1 Tax=uncultured Solirubrobacteraceae bacterium TaxID=1162706 RepID=A0A6J4SFN0_9ACTN|nr:MAG: D-alanyl-D-alanine carboxypeptidase [uncultured Solirubrobacteraceae bacterium]